MDVDLSISPPNNLNWIGLVCQLNLCLRALRSALREVLHDLDCSSTDAVLLICCHVQQDPVDQKCLVTLTGSSAAHVSTQIDALQQRGYVTGHRPRGDRRRQVWATTVLGGQLAQRILSRLEERLHHDHELGLERLVQTVNQLVSQLPAAGQGRAA